MDNIIMDIVRIINLIPSGLRIAFIILGSIFLISMYLYRYDYGLWGCYLSCKKCKYPHRQTNIDKIHNEYNYLCGYCGHIEGKVRIMKLKDGKWISKEDY